jgi:DNA-directed RNA polymerase specialized sigma24 family protein
MMGKGAEAMPVPDEALLERIAAGDAAALSLLYQRYGARLFAFLHRYARDRMVAEELLQDTLLALAFAAQVPHREIAEVLGVPVGTVKSRLHHARLALAHALAERGYVEERR